MKTIIIPTDYSVNALNAATYGFALAHQLDAKVLLFHAFHLPDVNSEIPMNVPRLTDLTAQHIGQLEKIGRKLKEKYPVHIEYAAKLGFFIEELSELVADKPGSLVVMGMRGANILEQKVLGTLTTAVLQRAAFPVLIVPADARVKPLQHILLACDYTSLSVDNSLNWLKDIAHTFRAEVQVLHIAQPETVLADGSLAVEGSHLERVLQGVNHQFAWLEEESVLEGIEQGIQLHHAELLVMVPRKRSFWDAITGHSHTRKMAFKTPIPLLALPNPVHEAY
jgi:nucleotide-binding universal stress UspA family protein